jgi:hypothetical protein
VNESEGLAGESVIRIMGGNLAGRLKVGDVTSRQ